MSLEEICMLPGEICLPFCELCRPLGGMNLPLGEMCLPPGEVYAALGDFFCALGEMYHLLDEVCLAFGDCSFRTIQKTFLACPPPGHCERSEATGGDRVGKKAQ